jgi:hypothetical protein
VITDPTAGTKAQDPEVWEEQVELLPVPITEVGVDNSYCGWGGGEVGGQGARTWVTTFFLPLPDWKLWWLG